MRNRDKIIEAILDQGEEEDRKEGYDDLIETIRSLRKKLLEKEDLESLLNEGLLSGGVEIKIVGDVILGLGDHI